jgi:hypothetical protein
MNFKKIVTAMSRICIKCKEHKLVELFRGNRNQCKPCESKLQSARYNAKPEYEKEYHSTIRRFKRHNTTKEWFDDKSQNGCEACGGFVNLVIDHDHACCAGSRSCGKCIRGVLCGNCNTAEGLLNSDIERAEKLIAYMKRHKC